jgi:hypothetical protein
MSVLFAVQPPETPDQPTFGPLSTEKNDGGRVGCGRVEDLSAAHPTD